MNSEDLLNYTEDIEVDETPARALSKDAEVIVAAAHAVYKEHIYLLMDYFVIKQWLSNKASSIAEELIEAPYKFPITLTTGILMRKFTEDP